MEQQHLAAVNTFGPEESDVRRGKWDTGPTFRRWDGAKTRIDYVVIPTKMMNRAVSVEVMHASAHKLQLANCAQLRDHQPVHVNNAVRTMVCATGEAREAQN